MIVAIIQARMGSNRLPGKVMELIDKIPLIEFQTKRVKLSKAIDKIVIATTTLNQDDVIEKLCNYKNLSCYRGNEKDVLSRYYHAAKLYKAKIIVRLTADCPFTDPELIDEMLTKFKKNNIDYLANTVPPESSKWPDGSDIEIFTIECLEKAFNEATSCQDREHVTFYFWKNNKEKFLTDQFSNTENWSNYRLTVDYQEDLKVVREVAKILKKEKKFGHISEIISILRKNPELLKINSSYHFGIGWKQ